MKTPRTEVISLLIIGLSTFCGAILSGHENHDITTDRKFGCQWEGGSDSSVTCTCRDDAEVMDIVTNSISSYQTSRINIYNCKKVRFGTKSVADMRNLRTIHLKYIQQIEFDRYGLYWYGYRDHNQFEERYDLGIPSLKVLIEHSNISKISSYTFEGRINEIHINNVTIEEIEAFAFTSLLQSQNIIIKDTELKTMRQQSFKKFSTENMELNGIKADLVPSRFISNITVYNNFKIKNCTFNTLRSGAFIVFNPKSMTVSDTKVDHLNGEAFRIITRGNVLFKHNQFNVIDDGAFQGITQNAEESIGNDLNINFESNLFTSLTRNSLRVVDLMPKYSDLKINAPCDCNSIEHKIKDIEFYTEIKCLYNSEFVTVKEYKSNMCSIMASYSKTIVIVGVVLTLCVIIGTVLVVYYKRIYNTKKYGNKNDNNQKKGGGNLSLIVPDGRTYRETELHVIVERADLLTTDL